MEDEYIPVKKLLLENAEEVKKMKTIYKKETKYLFILGPIEYTIALFYLQDRKIKDKDVDKAVKNIKSNYYMDISYFKKPLERQLMFAISQALQEKKITKRELQLVLGHILWAIDNRKWVGYNRAYLDWILHFFDLMNDKEKEKFDKRYEQLARIHSISEEELKALKGESSNHKLSKEDEKWVKKDSEYFAMSDDEKYNYLLP